MDHDRITIEANKRAGQPCIRGLRITVAELLAWRAAGIPASQILTDYPELEPADFPAAGEYATFVASHRKSDLP